jgi:hypothetical protein
MNVHDGLQKEEVIAYIKVIIPAYARMEGNNLM